MTKYIEKNSIQKIHKIQCGSVAWNQYGVVDSMLDKELGNPGSNLPLCHGLLGDLGPITHCLPN